MLANENLKGKIEAALALTGGSIGVLAAQCGMDRSTVQRAYKDPSKSTAPSLLRIIRTCDAIVTTGKLVDTGPRVSTVYPHDPTSPTKECRRCGKTKDKMDFGSDQSHIDGLSYYCKTCSQEMRERSMAKRVAERRLLAEAKALTGEARQITEHYEPPQPPAVAILMDAPAKLSHRLFDLAIEIERLEAELAELRRDRG